MEKIIDCHSHIGKDFFWIESNIDEYIKIKNNNNVTTSIIMPAPGQVVFNDPSKRYLYWEGNNILSKKYYSDVYNTLTNPYRTINDEIFKIISGKNDDSLKFIPIIHPLFDSNDEIRRLVDEYKPVALKIHGVACGIGPFDIPKDKITLLRDLNLPLIVHTDFSKEVKTLTEQIRLMNNPYDWCIFAINNDIKCYITHGARLDLQSFKLINENDNLVLGIGPDLKISLERERWINKIEEIEYLKLIKDYLCIDKILFDIDYSWNIDSNKNIDNKPIDRIYRNFNINEQKKILYKNAEKFFKI